AGQRGQYGESVSDHAWTSPVQMRLPNERVGRGGRARTWSGALEGTPASGNGDGRRPGRGAEMSGAAAGSGVRRSGAALDEREVGAACAGRVAPARPLSASR